MGLPGISKGHVDNIIEHDGPKREESGPTDIEVAAAMPYDEDHGHNEEGENEDESWWVMFPGAYQIAPEQGGKSPLGTTTGTIDPRGRFYDAGSVFGLKPIGKLAHGWKVAFCSIRRRVRRKSRSQIRLSGPSR